MSAASPGFTTRPDLLGSFGMAASTHWVASATAQAVLERGGNAFDAAVAAGFVLHVVEPHLNGPGGDLVAIIAPVGRDPQVLVGQGPAPAGASIEHFHAEGLSFVPGAGALAAAVPGAVEAWLTLLRDYGTWEVDAVLAFAIHYATVGQPALGSVAATIARVAELFRDHWPTSAALWLPDGRVPQTGDVLRNPTYAATLSRLVEAGMNGGVTREARIDAVRAEWSSGFVAATIDAFVRTPHRHSTGGDHAGVLRAEDMAAFTATYEAPVSLEFRGTTVLKAGGWTQGPALLQALAILDDSSDAELDLSTADGIHRVVEALKLALADRDAYYGDGMAEATLNELLSPDYARLRSALIGTTASREFRPGGSPAFVPPLREVSEQQAAAGEPTVRPTGETRGDTCHIDVVDRWGNMISVTPSGGWLQSSPTIPELGFALGTRLQMTWLDPSSPSALRPGQRPRTTLSPTMLARDGVVVAALGTPGGDQQDQWQLIYLLRTLAGGMTPQQALDAPMFHTTSFPESFWPRGWEPAGLVIEDRVGTDVIAELTARGHEITLAGDWRLGRLSSVGRDHATGILSAAANPRGAQGYAVGR